MKRHFFRLLLSAVLMMCCTQLFAAVGDTFKDDDFTYKITSEDDHTVEVAQNYSAKYSGCVYIEDNVQYNNTTYSVTSIGEIGFRGAGLEEVVIPASITSIGNEAFRQCRYLTSVVFTDNSQLKTIGEEAFAYCKGLHSLEIPASVTSIGKSAFESCDFLTDVTFADGSQLETIGGSAFSYCSGLTSVTIPSSVTTINEDAFNLCEGLKFVEFKGNTNISGTHVFTSCGTNGWLVNLILPDNWTGSTPGDDGSWYWGFFKSYRPSEYKQAALDAITAAMGEYKNSTYLQGLVATEINAINATTDIATITTQKDAAIAKTQAVVAAYPSIIAEGVEKGKAEAFGELGTEKTGTAVKVTKDDKEIILYAPDKVEYIITK